MTDAAFCALPTAPPASADRTWQAPGARARHDLLRRTGSAPYAGHARHVGAQDVPDAPDTPFPS